MDMKKSRVAAVCVAAVIVLAALFLIWQLAGEKGAIQRQLDCVDTKTKQKVTVSVSGTYTHYFFRADRFEGEISVEGFGKSEGKFVFDKNGEAAFSHDEQGQPFGSVRQQDQFGSIMILTSDLSLVSENFRLLEK